MPARPDSLIWLTQREMIALGFEASGPEEDFGWDAELRTRVSYAPLGTGTSGFLYAYDRHEDRYAVLAEHTTWAAAMKAYETVTSRRPPTQGFRELAGQLDLPMLTADMHAVWVHCLDREAAQRHAYEQLDLDAPNRFTAAHAFVLARAARVASEELLEQTFDPTRCASGAPAVVHYRITGREDWRGRVAGHDVTDAAFRVADLSTIAGQHGYRVEATMLSHGHVVRSATRVPELRAHAPAVDADRSTGLEL